MTLHDPARRPCSDPARPCDDPAATLPQTLTGSEAGGLTCAEPRIRVDDPAGTPQTLRGAR